MKKIFKWFFISLLTIIALGVPTIYLIILNSPIVSATWYDDSWAYRQAVTVTVTSSASDTTNSQTIISVNTSALGSKLQSACQDLRFTNTNGKVLPYYLASSCNNSSTTGVTIWVLVDLVPKNTTTYTMYMYYGNPGAAAGSDSSKFSLYTGLVGYWPMDEASWNGTSGEVVDSSGSGNHGTALTPSGPTTAAGKFGNGGSFDGTGDYVQTASNIGISGNPSFTIVAWFKATTLGDAETITRFGDTGTSLGAAGAVVMSNGAVGASFAGGNNAHTAASTISTGTWYHIAIVKTPGAISTTTSVYLNGVLQSLNSPSTNTPNITNGVVNMGRWYSSEDFDGQIDEVRVYNRALSATDVSQLYNTSQPATSFASEEKAPSPVAYWKFNDGQGTNAQDSTTTNADGTLAGTTVPAWKTEDLCISGKCLYFDGLTSKVTVSKVLPSVQTVSIWVKPNTSASTALIDLDGGTHKITTDASSVISAGGFDSPTIYVNGKVSSTLTANQWNYVTITTATSFASTSSLTIGLTGSTYFKGFIDEVKIYPYARSAAQIAADYNSRSNNEGASSQTGSSDSFASSGSLSNGLVGYWKMDEGSWTNDCSTATVTDSSGNGNNGTSCPNAAGTQPTAGKFGNGGSFDGSNDYVTISNTTGLSTENGTVQMLVKPNFASSMSGSRPVFFRWGSGNSAGNSTNTFDLQLQNAGSVLYFKGGATLLDEAIAGGGLSYSANTWHQVIATWDRKTGSGSNGTISIYWDGVRVASKSMIFTAISPSGNPVFGQSYNGLIDELRIYNRALSPNEVSALYNFAPPPKVYLKMDEGTGTSANDSSGNSNNATVNTGTWTTGKYGKGVNVSGSTGSDVSVPDFGY